MPTSNNPLTCTASRHGTASAYCNHQCRCPDAREAWRIYNKRRRENRLRKCIRSVDATGTRRRLRALTALGHSAVDLAAEFRVDHSAVTRWCQQARVAPATAAAVRDVYDRWSMVPGPDTPTGARLRAYARRKRWAPPLAWDDIDDPTEKPAGMEVTPVWRPPVDPVAVELLAAGKPVRHTLHERRAAIHRLTANGHSADDIATRLHVAGRTVVRHRHQAPKVAA